MQSMPDAKAEVVAEVETETTLPQTKVAFNGSIIEKYHQYQSNCQHYLDDLVSQSAHPGTVELVFAQESSILGAAVALACAVEGG